MLASSSDTCRLAILAASGDKKLLRLLSKYNSTLPNDPILLRWSLITLSRLASDDWARDRQLPHLKLIVALLYAEEATLAEEAAALLTNLVQSSSVFEALSGMGADTRLVQVVDGHPDRQHLLHSLAKVGLAEEPLPPAPLPPIAAAPNFAPLPPPAPPAAPPHAPPHALPPAPSPVVEALSEGHATQVDLEATVTDSIGKEEIDAGISDVQKTTDETVQAEPAAEELAQAATRIQGRVRGRQERSKLRKTQRPSSRTKHASEPAAEPVAVIQTAAGAALLEPAAAVASAVMPPASESSTVHLSQPIGMLPLSLGIHIHDDDKVSLLISGTGVEVAVASMVALEAAAAKPPSLPPQSSLSPCPVVVATAPNAPEAVGTMDSAARSYHSTPSAKLQFSIQESGLVTLDVLLG